MADEQLGDEAVLVDDEHIPTPVPVHGAVRLEGRVTTTEEAADFGTYRTVVLVGTEDKQQILAEDLRRVRATILCTGTGPVYIGSEAQCAAVRTGHPEAGGFVLTTGIQLFVGHKQSVWLVPDGSHSATVSIAQERMRT